MELSSKLEILSAAAKYDVSCASSGSSRRAPAGGTGCASTSGICHSWTSDGRCVSLLKILLGNDCAFDCAYCANRRSNDIPRASFTPSEVVQITMDFYVRNYIEGLFLSSAVCGGVDDTMERMVEVARLLRQIHRFGGYIHLKIAPGCPPELLHQAGLLADRLSVNIELPSEASLRLLAPQKSAERVFLPMAGIKNEMLECAEERRKSKAAPQFCPAGQSTQMIVGASPESDFQILRLSESLYRKFDLRRVYYSAYISVNSDNRLPAVGTPPLLREHRLYQADWLVRLYGFRADELLGPSAPFLDERLDPKAQWALRNLDQFPVDPNRASQEVLLRVPGVGLQSARRIVRARRMGRLSAEDLGKFGVVMKRARHFLRFDGTWPGPRLDIPSLVESLAEKAPRDPPRMWQPTLFNSSLPA